MSDWEGCLLAEVAAMNVVLMTTAIVTLVRTVNKDQVMVRMVLTITVLIAMTVQAAQANSTALPLTCW